MINSVSVREMILKSPPKPAKTAEEKLIIVSLLVKLHVKGMDCGSATSHFDAPSSTVPEPLEVNVMVLSVWQDSIRPAGKATSPVPLLSVSIFASLYFQEELVINSVFVLGVVFAESSF